MRQESRKCKISEVNILGKNFFLTVNLLGGGGREGGEVLLNHGHRTGQGETTFLTARGRRLLKSKSDTKIYIGSKF